MNLVRRIATFMARHAQSHADHLAGIWISVHISATSARDLQDWRRPPSAAYQRFEWRESGVFHHVDHAHSEASISSSTILKDDGGGRAEMSKRQMPSDRRSRGKRRPA
jgi:hypothetical protein